MRSREARSAGCPRISIVPESGPSMFITMRRVVVLPAPFGPSRPKMPPRGTERREVLHGHVAGVGLASRPESGWRLRSRRRLPRAHRGGGDVSSRAARGRSPAEGEWRGRALPGSSCLPPRRADEAAGRRAPLRRGPRAHRSASSSSAATRRSCARRSRKASPATSSAPQAAFDDWMKRPRARGVALVDVVRRLRRARRLRPPVPPESRRARRDLKSFLESLLGHYRVLRVALHRGRRGQAC